MQQFPAVRNQSLFDLAAQLHANIQALPLVLNSFPGDVDLTAPVDVGKVVVYDLEDELTQKKLLKRMDNAIVKTHKIYVENDATLADFNSDFNFDFRS